MIEPVCPFMLFHKGVILLRQRQLWNCILLIALQQADMTVLDMIRGTSSDTIEIENQNAQRAVVSLLEYRPVSDDPPSVIDLRISASCCDCTHVALVIPYGHDDASLGGEQVVFDACQTSIEVTIEKYIPYYLVIYLGVDGVSCLDHSEILIVELIIESV